MSALGRKMSPHSLLAFDRPLAKNGLKDRTDPATSEIARLIIQIAKDGERDPAVLADRATSIVRHSYWFRYAFIEWPHCGGWAHGPLPLFVGEVMSTRVEEYRQLVRGIVVPHARE
jgi:hypothetical protein